MNAVLGTRDATTRAHLIGLGLIKPRDGIRAVRIIESDGTRRTILVDDADMTVIRLQAWHR